MPPGTVQRSESAAASADRERSSDDEKYSNEGDVEATLDTSEQQPDPQQDQQSKPPRRKCHACLDRRSKCNYKHPTCSRCRTLQTACVYDPGAELTIAKKREYMSSRCLPCAAEDLTCSRGRPCFQCVGANKVALCRYHWSTRTGSPADEQTASNAGEIDKEDAAHE